MEIHEVTIESIASMAALVLAKIATEISSEATVVTLAGNLGAGKTTFVQALAAHLGVTDVVTSPTFVVMKNYALAHRNFDSLIHIDAYRIEDVAELGPLRLGEIFATPRTLVCVEWPERIRETFLSPCHNITLDIIENGNRRLTYEYKNF